MDILNQPTIMDELPNMNITAIKVDFNSLLDGKTLIESQLRNKTGVTLLAIKRGDEIIEHPSPTTFFQGNDIVYVLGNPEQVNLAEEQFTKEEAN
jgi:K+/H+ antiporter YhaU regulatory subunit KhtT